MMGTMMAQSPCATMLRRHDMHIVSAVRSNYARVEQPSSFGCKMAVMKAASAQSSVLRTFLTQQQIQWPANHPRRTWQVRDSTKRERELESMGGPLPDFEELDRDELQAFLELELESDFDLENSRHYEIMFLIPEQEVEKVPEVIKKVEAFVAERKGKLYRLDNWGLRRLAYKIKKASRANYVLMNIEIKAQAINELNTLFEKDERVIRHMVITQKEAITEATTPPPNYFPESGEVQEDEYESDVEEDSESDSSEDEGDEVIEGQGRFVAL